MILVRNAYICAIAMFLFAFGAIIALVFIGPIAVVRISSQPTLNTEVLASGFLLFTVSSATLILIIAGYLLLHRLLCRVECINPLRLSDGRKLLVEINDNKKIIFKFDKNLLGEDSYPILVSASNIWYIAAGEASKILRT